MTLTSKSWRSAALGAALVAATLAPQAAKALVLNAIYWEVADGSDPDFNVFSTPTGIGNLVGGVPTATGGIHDLTSLDQITWWRTSMNPNVIFTGTGTITTPYANFAMFPPNSTGSSDADFFETAQFTGSIFTASPKTITVTVASDDDSLVYLNGVYIGGQPGVKPIGSPSILTATTAAGLNTLEVFYADRENVAAALTLNVGIPEPSTWAMMALGFAGLGFAGYRRAKKMAALVAA
jgi:hypothetical protein